MRTRLAEELGLEFPIFAFTHCRDVAAAVSRAGGLGVLGVAGHSLENLRMELEWIEKEVGGKPYGVDLLLPTRFVGSNQGGLDGPQLDALIPAGHRRFVDDLLARHDVPALPADVSLPDEFSVGYERQRDVIELVFQHPIRLIASALGPPPPWMIEKGREKGVRVAALAGTVEHARRHAEAGVDIVVAQGTEAGGHTGEISTMVLVPEVVDAVAPIPVLAAGGIGKPARMLRTAWTEAWDDPANPQPLPMPLQPRLVREAQARISRSAHKSPGAAELADYFVGQIVGSMNQVKSVRAVIEELVQEYADAMERLDALARESE
jgi:NAD(P)H-dependent flavin oxidoreductase YrpB (nitropropane dioxygenase family)